MGKIGDAVQILQRVMEYKIASRDVLKSAIKRADDRDKPLLETFYAEQVETLKKIPVVFQKLKFDAPKEANEDSVTEMMDCIFIEAAASGTGKDLDFRRAALSIEEKAMKILKKPLLEHSIPAELRNVLEESLLMAQIHASQLRKMVERG